MAYVVKPLV